MAQNTPVNISLRANDWEHIVGIMDNSTLPAFRKLKRDLQNYYELNGNPQNTTLIPVTTKEYLLVAIFEHLYGTSTSNVYSDNGGSPISRIATALRAANNTADNYISQSIAAFDTRFTAARSDLRKRGREILMPDTYDGN